MRMHQIIALTAWDQLFSVASARAAAKKPSTKLLLRAMLYDTHINIYGKQNASEFSVDRLPETNRQTDTELMWQK